VGRQTFIFVRQIQGEVEKTPSWWLKKSSRQACICRSRRNVGANEHGSHRGRTNCWRTHLTSRILDYRREARWQPLRFPRVPQFANRSDKAKGNCDGCLIGPTVDQSPFYSGNPGLIAGASGDPIAESVAVLIERVKYGIANSVREFDCGLNRFTASANPFRTSLRHPGTRTASNGYAAKLGQKDELKDTMIRMREKGLQATGCNSVVEYSYPRMT